MGKGEEEEDRQPSRTASPVPCPSPRGSRKARNLPGKPLAPTRLAAWLCLPEPVCLSQAGVSNPEVSGDV